MVYLWLLRRLSGLTGRLLKHANHGKSRWAWLAYYDGRIAFRQLRYAERVQKASGWEPVEVVTPQPVMMWPSLWTATTGTANTTFRINGHPMHDA